MKITDEMVEAAAKAQHHERYPWVRWDGLKPESRAYYRNEVRAPVTAALAHLTDDGAAATPPAETGVRSALAAESAIPVGAGSAAPSSPHLREILAAIDGERGYMDNWAARARNDALMDAREAVEKLFGEGATPAIDRGALRYLLSYHYYDAKWSKEHQGFRCVCGWLGEDHVAHVADLIAGAS